MPIDFAELSAEEATRFLEDWVAGLDERAAWVEERAPGARSRHRAGLRAAWEWFLSERPFPDRGAVPRWAADHDTYYVPAGDLVVVDAIASYFTRVLREGYPDLELTVGHQPGMKRYVHRRKPVLRFPDGHELDPIGITMAGAANAGERPDPDELAVWWDRAAERLARR